MSAPETPLLAHARNGLFRPTWLEKYDADGALTFKDVLGYPASNNRVSQETISSAPPVDGTGGSNAANVYDLSGFITRQGPVGYQYDDARQMKRYLRSGVNVRYVYDAARRRVLKTGTEGDTRFVYDPADHLVYEVNPDGSQRNYVWLGDIPLAVIDQTAAGAQSGLYFIETDFANTPRYLRRATGDLSKPVWEWAFAPYGDQPAKASPVSFNLRYPGQYYDAESKLHYNHTRYFQPRTGRYLQPDLIGLEGGVNVYTYANGNPVHYIDPTGTEACQSFSQMLGNWINSALDFVDSMMNSSSENMEGDSSQKGGGESKGASNAGNYRPVPDRELPRDKHGNPVPDTDTAHTQIGTKEGRKGNYTQGREWGYDSNGKLVAKRDIDFTDHGRPQNHPNPHQHDYLPNPTGGTPMHGPSRPLE